MNVPSEPSKEAYAAKYPDGFFQPYKHQSSCATEVSASAVAPAGSHVAPAGHAATPTAHHSAPADHGAARGSSPAANIRAPTPAQQRLKEFSRGGEKEENTLPMGSLMMALSLGLVGGIVGAYFFMKRSKAFQGYQTIN